MILKYYSLVIFKMTRDYDSKIFGDIGPQRSSWIHIFCDWLYLFSRTLWYSLFPTRYKLCVSKYLFDCDMFAVICLHLYCLKLVFRNQNMHTDTPSREILFDVTNDVIQYDCEMGENDALLRLVHDMIGPPALSVWKDRTWSTLTCHGQRII